MGKFELDLDTGEADNGLTINKGYAQNYEKWRSKEVLQHLKDKYQGRVPDGDEEEDSPSESEPEWTVDDEKSFFRTLGALKSKDPKIYNKEVKFFKEKVEKEGESSIAKPKKELAKTKMTLRDYEVALVTEKHGKFDDEFDERFKEDDPKPEGYYEKSARIKDEIKKAIQAADEDDSDDDFLKKKEKSQAQHDQEEEDFTEWLKGEGKNLNLDPDDGLFKLKNQWSNVDGNEAFLRDYLLNKKYEVGSGDEADGDDYDEMLELEDELNKAAVFEKKYNFRFEEPDQDFIKQFPRTVTESIRKVDDKRKSKREERKTRKDQEKQQQKEEIKTLKSLKKRQIEEKLRKLREICGDDSIPISLEDLEKEFDPKEYDEKMKQMFDDDYYKTEGDDNVKPVFSDLSDDDAELSDYDNMPIGAVEDGDAEDDEEDNEAKSDEEEVANLRKNKTERKGKRNTKFKEMVAKKKPIFDPSVKSFDEYLKEYYDLDYEDILPGNVKTKFKYNAVPENDFGLTTDEILTADDTQLNQWVSVKKASQYRSQHEEDYDKKAYMLKGKNDRLKAKIFARKNNVDADEKPKNVVKPKKEVKLQVSETESVAEKEPVATPGKQGAAKKKNRRKNKSNNTKSIVKAKIGVDVDRLKAYNISNKAIKRKIFGGQTDAKKHKGN